MSKLFLLVIIFFTNFLFAVTKDEIYKAYQEKNYKKACEKGTWILSKNKNDENYLSLVALSCINNDMLNTSIRISRILGKTKMGRANASYIANLYLIKKLLIEFIYDNIDLSNLSLPKSNNFLSEIFENLSKKNYIKNKNGDIIIKANNNKKYIISKVPNEKGKILIIINNNNNIEKHIYW